MLAILVTLAIGSAIVVIGSINQRQAMRQILEPFDLQMHLAQPGDPTWDPRDRPRYGAIFHRVQTPGQADCQSVCDSFNFEYFQSSSWTSVAQEYLLDSASFDGCIRDGNLLWSGRLVSESPNCFDANNISTVCQCTELFLHQ